MFNIANIVIDLNEKISDVIDNFKKIIPATASAENPLATVSDMPDVSEITSDIEAIEAVIPATATTSNKLATVADILKSVTLVENASPSTVDKETLSGLYTALNAINFKIACIKWTYIQNDAQYERYFLLDYKKPTYIYFNELFSACINFLAFSSVINGNGLAQAVSYNSMPTSSNLYHELGNTLKLELFYI